MRRLLASTIFWIAALGFICAAPASGQPSYEWWNPRTYPSLSRYAPLHAFDSELNLIDPSTEELLTLTYAASLSYCKLDQVNFLDESSLATELPKCQRAVGNSEKYVIEPLLASAQVKSALRDLRVISHYPNDKAGFSATLFRAQKGGGAILAIRGMEVQPEAEGGDQKRDMAAMADLKKFGFTFPQIDSAQRYVNRLISDGLIGQDETLTIVGTDLGSHVAFSINELFPKRIQKIVVVDGIGYLRPSKTSGRKEAKITNYEAPGNLQARTDLGCLKVEELRNTYTAADLYQSNAACVKQDDLESAVYSSALAGVYSRYDSLRVVDQSSHQAQTVLRMHFAASMTEEQKKRFMARFASVARDPSSLAVLCGRLRFIGPPDYHPTYMIQHGLSAFTGGSGNGLVADFDSAAMWEKSLDTYLHCPKP